jgi:hypothetical protein
LLEKVTRCKNGTRPQRKENRLWPSIEECLNIRAPAGCLATLEVIVEQKSWLHNMFRPVWLRRTKLWRKQG